MLVKALLRTRNEYAEQLLTQGKLRQGILAIDGALLKKQKTQALASPAGLGLSFASGAVCAMLSRNMVITALQVSRLLF